MPGSNDYDVVFLSYREPNAEENYQDLLEKLSSVNCDINLNVTRVHGVKGVDNGYKLCGRYAHGKHVITIDGDCKIDPSFFTEVVGRLQLDETSVFLFPAENMVNGLRYGNGGIKIWPVKLLLNAGPMGIDFACALPRRKGHLLNKCYAFTYINACVEQAWTSGFREGVKLAAMHTAPGKSLDGVPTDDLRRLRVWCCVGADVQNGAWAILGARQGTLFSLGGHPDLNYLVNDFDWLSLQFRSQQLGAQTRVQRLLEETEAELNDRYNFEVSLFSPRQSRIFKLSYFNPKYIVYDSKWVPFVR